MSFRMIRRAAVLALSGLAALSLSFAVSAQSYQALVPFLIDLPQWQGEKPDGMPRKVLDSSRMRDATGWTARTGLADGLGRAVRDYRAAREGSRAVDG